MTTGLALLARDPALVERVRRLAAIAGAPVDAATDGGEVRRCWRLARLVLVEAALADDVARLDLARRDGVVLLADDPDLLEVWQGAARLGAQQVLDPVGDEQRVLDLMAAASDPADGPPGAVIGVVPGCGGAGASTLAVAVAVRAAATGPATLIDADPAGGGLDLLLGAERVEGMRWPDLADVRGVVASRALDDALPHAAGVRVVSHTAQADGEVPTEAMTAVLSAARRRSGVVIVDLPRRLSGAEAAAAAACDVLVLVALAEVRAVASAALTLHLAARTAPDVRLLVRAPSRSRLRPAEVAAALGVPVWATIPFAAELPAAADRGDLVRVLGKAGMVPVADRVLSVVSEAAPMAS